MSKEKEEHVGEPAIETRPNLREISSKFPDAKAFSLMLLMAAASSAGAETRALPEVKHGKGAMQRVAEMRPTGDMYFRFQKQNPDGTLTFNPWSILAPVQLEIGYQLPETKEVKFDLPYRYSRMFDTAEVVDPASKQEVIDIIDRELKAEFAQSAFFLDFSNNSRLVYSAYHDEHGDNLFEKYSHADLSTLKIKGFASPEGPASKGPTTLSVGSIDKENIQLAEKRAGDVEPTVREELSKFGINLDAVSEISGEEIQFSELELEELALMATNLGLGGSSDVEKIFNIVKAYNSNELQNANEQVTRLDELIGAKRMVEVAVTFKTNEEKRIVIPVPILLLLLVSIPYLIPRWPGLPRWPWKRKLKHTGEVGRIIFSEKEVDYNEGKPTENEVLDFKSLLAKADEEVSPIERGIMQERMLNDEILRYMDDYPSILSGLDYRREIEGVAKLIKDNPKMSEDELVQEVSMRMLIVWQKHDGRSFKRSHKFDAQTGARVLEYHQDLKKVKWAKIAAALMIAEARRE